MSPHIELSEQHEALVTKGRAFIEQKVLLEADKQDALREAQADGNAETIRLAQEAVDHAELMTAASFMELYLEFRLMAREEIAAEAPDSPFHPNTRRTESSAA